MCQSQKVIPKYRAEQFPGDLKMFFDVLRQSHLQFDNLGSNFCFLPVFDALW